MVGVGVGVGLGERPRGRDVCVCVRGEGGLARLDVADGHFIQADERRTCGAYAGLGWRVWT